MLEIFVGANYRWMDRRRYAYFFSGALVVLSLISLIAKGGPRESIDFTGGNVLYVAFDQPADVTVVREAAGAVPLDGAEIQMAERNTQAIIRYRVVEGQAPNQFQPFKQAFDQRSGGVQASFLSQESVGPKIGKELEAKAAWAILWSLILILAYVAWRFTRISFGLGSVIALFHDVIIVLGLFSVLNREIDLTVVAALLTLGGYSINDTIVVFDRVRENMGLARRMSMKDIIDKSVNQTLSRTILTGGTTIVSLIALFFLGGTVIHDFALALLVGIVFGTYSSVYVGSALALDLHTWWTRRKQSRGESKPAKAVAAQ
jgi:preprotein translocase subunit SecF